ncbi:hypothetical protein [Sphingobium cupriresistens]|uniref:Uncharacterized protein n=1 Tax=Sphingobium cupriresistens TaxID=1132417 RepID=A0A8G1ZDC1_9SPHN|nr:hypothetical protein [Sphingobium cupriresistens]RYM07982.1 hypothetical protein EWH12_17765 [Sphingobium cupriresistens]
MPEDLNDALERFQIFVGRFGLDDVIDEDSGFTHNDAMLLAGEIEMAIQTRGMGAGGQDPDTDGLLI